MTATTPVPSRVLRRAFCLSIVAALSLPGPAFGGTKHGIDVSHHQGRIRWSRVAQSGVDFAFIKASEGVGVRDPRYSENRNRAQASNIRVGAYHFARPSGAKKKRVRQDARLEARYFLNVAKPKARDLAPVLDLETAGILNRPQLRRWTATWLRHVKREIGVRAIVYAGPVFWRDRMSGTAEFARKHPLWVAHYTRRRPDVPAGGWAGEGWTFWQWTDCGRVRGIRGCVDRNRFAEDTLNAFIVGPELRSTVKRPSGGKKDAEGRRGKSRNRRHARDDAKKVRENKGKDEKRGDRPGRSGKKERGSRRTPSKQERPRKSSGSKKGKRQGHRAGGNRRPVAMDAIRGTRHPYSGPGHRRWTRRI